MLFCLFYSSKASVLKFLEALLNPTYITFPRNFVPLPKPHKRIIYLDIASRRFQHTVHAVYLSFDRMIGIDFGKQFSSKPRGRRDENHCLNQSSLMDPFLYHALARVTVRWTVITPLIWPIKFLEIKLSEFAPPQLEWNFWKYHHHSLLFYRKFHYHPHQQGWHAQSSSHT